MINLEIWITDLANVYILQHFMFDTWIDLKLLSTFLLGSD